MAELVALRLALPSRLDKQPLDLLLEGLTPPPVRSIVSARAERSLSRDVRCAEFALRLMPWAASTCLYRALARYAVLRRSGLDATFVMGVGPRGVEDDGHAWVEVEGNPFEEPSDVTRYAVTFRYPPAPTSGENWSRLEQPARI